MLYLSQEIEFLNRLDRLHNDFSNFKKPLGTKLFPALTCKTLFKDHSHLKSGKFICKIEFFNISSFIELHTLQAYLHFLQKAKRVHFHESR